MATLVLLLAATALVAAAEETVVLTGTVTGCYGDPVEGALVRLYTPIEGEVRLPEEEEAERMLVEKLIIPEYMDDPVAEEVTDDEGRYTIEGVPPGVYDVACTGPFHVPEVCKGIALEGGGMVTLDIVIEERMLEVEKPNIYLYPVTETEITVRLDFPAGGGLTVSDPPYGDGWTVRVTPESVIDGGHGHLFYEAEVPPEWQFERAWVVQQRQVETFFTENLTAHGFNGSEIADFIEHWIPRLEDHPFYVIYPQYAKEIEPMIRLTIEPEPDGLLRLYYAISGVDFVERYVPEPEVQSFYREGFTVCEWGVVLLSDDQTVH